MPVRSETGRCRGFSLVELVVSVSILATLLALALPGLARARDRADEIRLLSTQRESMRLLSLYSADHGGLYPVFSSPEGRTASFVWRGRTIQIGYWSQPYYYGLYLASQGYEEAWITKGPKADPGAFELDRVDPACPDCGWDPRSWHTLTHAVYAKPSFFRQGDSTLQDARLLQPQRRDAVVHTSLKGILRWRVRLLHPRQPERAMWQVVHFEDEHGAITPYTKLRAGAWDRPGEKGWTILATIDGVRGRDL